MKAKSDDLRPEYPADLIKQGICAKYTRRFRDSNLAIIEPDLHEHFPDSEAVNRALRDYLTQKQRT